MIDLCHFRVGYWWYPFTWCNLQDGMANISEQLDRFMATEKWMELYPLGLVFHFPFFHYDHLPIILDLYCRHNYGSYRYRLSHVGKVSCLWESDKAKLGWIVHNYVAWIWRIGKEPILGTCKSNWDRDKLVCIFYTRK